MSTELNMVLSRIEQQLKDKGMHFHQDNHDHSTQHLSQLNNKYSFNNEDDDQSKYYYECNNNKYNSFLSKSFSLSNNQQLLLQNVNEIEARKLIEQELQPYIQSIKKEIDINMNKLRQEFKEQTHLSFDYKSFKDTISQNRKNISKLENELKILNTTNSLNNITMKSKCKCKCKQQQQQLNDNTTSINLELSVCKLEIKEINKRLNELNVKYEKLNRDVQEKDTLALQTQVTLNKETEDKLYKEINILKTNMNKHINNNNNNNDSIINKVESTFNVNNVLFEELNDKVKGIEQQVGEMNNKMKSQMEVVMKKFEEQKNVVKEEDNVNKEEERCEGLQKEMNELMLFKDNQEKYNDIFQQSLMKLVNQTEQYNKEVKILASERVAYEGNFDNIQQGFDKLNNVVYKVGVVESKMNTLEEVIRQITQNIEALRQQTGEQFEEIDEIINEYINNTKHT